MFPWLNPALFRMPASGDVWQRVTNDWFSPKIQMNFAGDPQIEQEVTEEVASYGKQLGILMEAVIALAEPDEPKSVKVLTENVRRLKKIQDKVEKIKKRRAPEIEEAAAEAMQQLKSASPDRYKQLLERLAD